MNTCGGCPGKKAVIRAAEMVKRGTDTIVLASCITKGNPIGFACPHAEQMRAAIEKKVGETIKIIIIRTDDKDIYKIISSVCTCLGILNE